ncbi:MAG TPA: MFS transporter [Saprospiraceae bacterium]|nr:MFS transporter [Saprospiraceae bacterium]
MQGFWRFLYKNWSLLFFGLLLTFFSSFGQTFLISLYIPSLEQFFSLSNTEISSMYATATMASAFTLPWLGKLVDTLPLRRFVLLVILGLVVACLGFSFIQLSLLLIPAFYGLRLFGQGLMSHTAITTMARAFEADRGKAIGISTTGHSMGEAILPFLISLVILNAGWRTALRIEALLLFVLVLPLLLILLRGQSKPVLYPRVDESSKQGTSRNPLLLFKDRKFWIIGPTVFILGFMNTAVFFYQLKFGASRGWAPEWMAGSLAFFALGGALSMVIAGPFVDRLSAKRLFPLVLFPYLIGVLLLALGQSRLIYPLALVCLAVSNGAGSTIKNALFAEVYGTEIIGAVRSMFTTIMVFSTALGPLSFGLLLDAGWSFGQVFLLSAAVLLAIIIWSWLRYKRL